MSSHLKGFDGADLAVGVAYGVRRWGVDDLGRLLGVSHSEVWTPGENVAKCKAESTTFGTFTVDVDWTITPGFSINNYAYTSAPPGKPQPAIPSDPQPVPKQPHDAPGQKCGCGLWAYFGGQAFYGDEGTVGVMAGYGRVLMGPLGFRAERGRIVALRLKPSHPMRSLIIRNYPDVPIFTSRKAMLAEYPTSTEFMLTPDTDPEFWTRPAVRS